MEPCTSNSNLPPGMNELVGEFFAPGVKGYFERNNVHLPLLESTRRVTSQSGNGRSPQGSENSHRSEPSGQLGLVKASWDTVLAFMEDQREPLENGQSTHLFESTISQRRKQFRSKKRNWMRDSDSLIRRKRDDFKTSSLNGLTSNGHETASRVNTTTSSSSGVSSIDSRHLGAPESDFISTKESIAKLTVMEKVRFLTSIGLEHTSLQNEIYCQILKQLVCNPSVRSGALGWILLSLVCGCFAPSETIRPYIEKFLIHNNNSWSKFCLLKLSNFSGCADRIMPPCSLELQAAKSRLPIRLPVICMDHSVRTIWAHSCTTAGEMCHAMASKNRLGDSFGFSLFLAMDDKLVTLGNGLFYVMDAISQAEEYNRQNEVHDVWRIYYRREFFSPWDACGIQDNQMKAWLTYSQICGGVQSEEYQCQTAQDLSLLIAHQYCVRHGTYAVDSKRVQAVCEQNLPTFVFKEDRKRWCQMVTTTLIALKDKADSSQQKVDVFDIMQQVIRFASKSFIRNFTKTFLLSSFEPLDSNGGQINDRKLLLRVNHERFSVVREEITRPESDSNKLFEVDVTKLTKSELISSSNSDTSKVKLVLEGGNTYYATSPQANDIRNIFERFLDEIRSAQRNESEA